MVHTLVNEFFYNIFPSDIKSILYERVLNDAKRDHKIEFAHVLTQIELRNLGSIDDRESIWKNPSQRLLSLTKDVGCVDKYYFKDFFYSYDDDGEGNITPNDCLLNNYKCRNCENYNFPCANLVGLYWKLNTSCMWENHFIIKI